MITAGRPYSDLVLVAAFAARPGRERRIAGENARRWYLRLGASRVELAEDVDDGFRELLGLAGLLVLPGGSPQRLLEALAPSSEQLRRAADRGTAISGSSAGAMVLCRWTLLPGGRTRVATALGLVPVDLVLPHYSGRTRSLELAREVVGPGCLALGIPERSEAVVRPDGTLQEAGVESFHRLTL